MTEPEEVGLEVKFRQFDFFRSVSCSLARDEPQPVSLRLRWPRSIRRSQTSLSPLSRPNVYQIVLVATLLPLAALGEIAGHRRVYLAGLLLFTLASFACTYAWSLPTLLTARVLQGPGAGAY